MIAEKTYQKTGIIWMPEIPLHWKLGRVKSYFDFADEIVGENFKDYKVLSLSIKGSGVIIRNMDGGGKYSLSMDKYQVIYPNSIVCCLYDMDVTPRIIGYCNHTGIITNSYTNVMPKENVFSKFYYYFFLQQDINKSLMAQGTGVRTTLTNNQFGAIKIPVPPYKEQIKIANYLDSQVEKIKTFITKKQTFISLLKEQRQSVIDNAVTKGLNKNVKFKNTGIDWLGDIPEHWEVRRLASFGKFSKGGNVSKGDLIKDQNGEHVLLYGDIYTKYEFEVENLINRISKETAEKSTLIMKGDLLFTGSGEDKAEIGKCIVYTGYKVAYTGGDVIIFRQNEFDSRFISYSQNTNMVEYQKYITSKGDIIVHTYSSKLKNIVMPFPPTIEEQTQIINHIKTETSKIDQAITKAEKEIALIQEYQKAMIAEAVLGVVSC